MLQVLRSYISIETFLYFVSRLYFNVKQQHFSLMVYDQCGWLVDSCLLTLTQSNIQPELLCSISMSAMVTLMQFNRLGALIVQAQSARWGQLLGQRGEAREPSVPVMLPPQTVGTIQCYIAHNVSINLYYSSIRCSFDFTREFNGEHTQTIINGLLPG